MSNYVKLSISPEPLTLAGITLMNYNKATVGERHFRRLLDISNHIDPTVVTLLDQCNLYIRFAELFYTPANRNTLIHIDGEPNEYAIPGNMAKINFIGGGDDSLMNWYKPIVTKPYEATGRNKFISFDAHEVNLVDSANLVGYNIAQTGIPHNITTHAQSRYCVSMTLAIKHKKPLMIPYESLVTLLDRFRF